MEIGGKRSSCCGIETKRREITLSFLFFYFFRYFCFLFLTFVIKTHTHTHTSHIGVLEIVFHYLVWTNLCLSPSLSLSLDLSVLSWWYDGEL